MSYSWGSSSGPAPEDLPVLRSRPDRGPLSPPAPVRPALADDPASGLEHVRLAAELAPMVGTWQRLLDLHVPDGFDRCRTCTKGGTGLSVVPWPCAIHGLAEMARRRYEDS